MLPTEREQRRSQRRAYRALLAMANAGDAWAVEAVAAVRADCTGWRKINYPLSRIEGWLEAAIKRCTGGHHAN